MTRRRRGEIKEERQEEGRTEDWPAFRAGSTDKQLGPLGTSQSIPCVRVSGRSYDEDHGDTKEGKRGERSAGYLDEGLPEFHRVLRSLRQKFVPCSCTFYLDASQRESCASILHVRTNFSGVSSAQDESPRMEIRCL